MSKQHRRLITDEGYDLDMTYITDRLVAMAYPAQKMQSLLRNPMWQVRAALDNRHGSHYKVYNLCAEACYDPQNFHGRVEMWPFEDNHVPPFSLIKSFCESVHAWLAGDPQNVAVVHCMAGKGRTGLMTCCYLVFKGMPAEEALQLYADRRSTNNEGVSIASQRRYVGFWAKIVEPSIRSGSEVRVPPSVTRELRRIRLYDTSGTVKFRILQLMETPGQLFKPAVEMATGICQSMRKGLHRSVSPRYYLSFLSRDGEEKKVEAEKARWVVQMETEKTGGQKRSYLEYYFEKPLSITDDFRIIFYDKSGSRMFYACYNTSFIQNSMIQLSRKDMDKDSGTNICGPSFGAELLFGPVGTHYPVQPELPTLEASDNLDELF